MQMYSYLLKNNRAQLFEKISEDSLKVKPQIYSNLTYDFRKNH